MRRERERWTNEVNEKRERSIEISRLGNRFPSPPTTPVVDPRPNVGILRPKFSGWLRLVVPIADLTPSNNVFAFVSFSAIDFQLLCQYITFFFFVIWTKIEQLFYIIVIWNICYRFLNKCDYTHVSEVEWYVKSKKILSIGIRIMLYNANSVT